MAKRGKTALFYKPKQIEEAFKTKVEIKKKNFPKDLGEEHPFNFEELDKLCSKMGIAGTILDKHRDFIISPQFHVKSDVKKAEVLINDFIREEGFDILLSEWIYNGLKGNGYLEIADDKKTVKLKNINPSYMYIKRDEQGEVEEFNQYVGAFDKFDKTKVIGPLKPNQIVHLAINKSGDCPYGYGIIYPLIKTLDYLAMSEKDSHILTMRKANNPYDVEVGDVLAPASEQELQEIGANFEYLNNLHEWVHGHRVKIKTLDFGNLGDKFTGVMEHDLQMISYISQIPAVYLGMANIPEGLGISQGLAWERRIAYFQAIIEKIVEEQIFKRILKLNGLDAHVEFIWGLPDNEQINKRIEKLTMLASNLMLSPQLRAMIEIDIATSLGYEEKDIKLLPKPSMMPETSEIEKKQEKEIKQPEIPGEKPTASESLKSPINERIELKSWVWKESEDTEENLNNLKITEWLNFDYNGYQDEVIKFIESDEFKNLKANNKEEISLGLLNSQQINLLRNILKENFEKNATLGSIIEDLKKLDLKDRYTLVDGQKKLVLNSDQRRSNIARSEVTRVSNESLLNHFQNKGVEKVRFLSSISARTCPVCLGLNGQVYNLEESRGVIPVHQNCRCGWVAITE